MVPLHLTSMRFGSHLWLIDGSMDYSERYQTGGYFHPRETSIHTPAHRAVPPPDQSWRCHGTGIPLLKGIAGGFGKEKLMRCQYYDEHTANKSDCHRLSHCPIWELQRSTYNHHDLLWILIRPLQPVTKRSLSRGLGAVLNNGECKWTD